MTYAVFAPTVSPFPGTSGTGKIRTRTNDFGDQYSQSIPDGINTVEEEITMQWSAILAEVKEEIISFFETQNSAPFVYLMPGALNPKLYRCTDWNYTYLEHKEAYSLTATFGRVYG
jgi:phage-related protein